MSSGITGFFSDFFQGFIYPIRLFFRWCNWMGVVLFGFLFTVVKFTFQALTIIYDHIQQMAALYQETGQVVNGQTSSSISTLFVTVNTFFPLDLVLVYFSMLLQMWVFWNIYRLVKSWIPTLS